MDKMKDSSLVLGEEPCSWARDLMWKTACMAPCVRREITDNRIARTIPPGWTRKP